MQDPIETIGFEHGVVAKIYVDDDPENPREHYDHLGKMVCFHRRYDLGDKHDYSDLDELLHELAAEADPTVTARIEYWEDGDGFKKIENFYATHPTATTGNPESKAGDSDYIKVYQSVAMRVEAIVQRALEEHFVILPLYLYDHSGITMSTGAFSCPWDSGQVGWIYVSVADVKKEWGWKVLTKARRERIEKLLESEVEEYDQYLTGQVYGYVVEDGAEEQLDSCWGFFGEEYCKDEATSSAKYFVKKFDEERELATIEEVGECCN